MKKYFLMALCFLFLSNVQADEYTDWMNYLEDAETAANSASSLVNQASQIQNQIQSIQIQSQNTGTLKQYQFNDIMNLMNRMDNLSQQGKSLSYAASDTDQKFRQYYPDYGNQNSAQNYTQAYKSWNSTTLQTMQNTMSANHANAADIQSESQLIANLREQGSSATGRMQAAQISTEIASENVNQLQELKRITLSQANSENAYMAYRVSKDSYKNKSLSQLAGNTKTQFPPYQNDARFGLLKQADNS